ncbi:uncharacterized protein LOC100203426 isoform X9 [Hydra vulgaris]|uniref:uncharacterized protein LOC100203426 isoform X9 n=1 Tax=Hydra vulgaris TaxID=6087 RepID=UPI001F5EB2FD|nr:uncharacterized protein LOC100203426 isoform X10 [Hydra vulgaris]
MRIAVQYIFILTLCGSSHGTSKVKRDISDLKNDPILSSIFASDKENSRKDRSIINDHHDSNLKKQLLENTDKQKRDADLLPELMTLNSNSNNNEPIISKPIPIPDNDPALLVLDTSQSAVNPSALFANFLPLTSDAQQGSFLSWYPWSGKVNTISNKPYTMSKKSVLPNIFEDINIPLTVDKKDDVPHVHRSSFPVQLRVHSPNENLLGIVPHVPEYGETVASIQTARSLVENTRSSIPHPSDNLAIKAPEDEVIVTKSIIPNTIFTNIPAPAAVEKKSVTNEQKRQYIPTMQLNNLFYPQYQQYQVPQYSNYLQYPAINVQQSPIVQPMYPSTVQSLQQQSAISNEPCTDQYPMCTAFAKNNYCFNYPDLMKIQCRKSCGHCIPSFTPVETVVANDTTANVENQSKSAVIKAAKGRDSKKSNDKGSKLTEKVKKVKSKSKITTIVVHKKPDEKLKTQTIKHKEFDGKATVSTSKYKNEGIDEEDSGSGSSGSGLDAEGESGLSEESGSGVNTVNTKSFNVSKILITKNNTKPHTTVKKLVDAKIQGTEKKSRRSKIPDKKQVSHPGFSEFKLPVKKSVIPVSSLALADKNGDDIDSGSGDSLIETASTKSKIVSNVTEKSSSQQSAKPLPKVLTKAVKKKNSKNILINVPKSKNKNIGHAQNVSIIAKPKSKTKKTKKQGVNIKIVHKEKKNKAKTKRNQHKILVVKKNKGEKNVTVKVENKSTKNKTNIKKKDEQIIVKKQEISQRPENANSAIFASKYPRIDLRAIANALAKYESAALELAGEYPKPAQFDMTEYQRSSIPHPETLYVNNIEQNIQIAELVTKTERDKKNIIPKYLKLSTDVFKDGDSFLDTENADSLDSVRRRFEIPGIEPTLNDYYSETGKINPFSSKQNRYKKSQIMKIKTMNTSSDPYEYLRNMPPGASMEPIEDPRKRSNIPSDHSFPVFLMKVSPADQKYKPEEASKRGKVHHLNAEGLPIDDKENGNNNAPITSSPVEDHHDTQQNFVNTALVSPMNIPSYPQAMQFVPPPYMQPGFFQYPGVPALPEEHAAVSPPIGFTVEQLTAPRTSTAFAHEDQVENQPKDSLRSKMLSAFFTVKNGEGVSDEGSGATSSDKIGKSNLGETGSGDGNEDAQKPVISLHNLLKNDLLLSDDKSSNIGKSSSFKSPSNNQQDPSANYLRSNLAALTPESGKSNTDEQSVMSGEHAMSTKMRKTQETNWMRPNPESELASALPESYIDSSVPSKETSSHQNSLNQAFLMENASPRDQIPSKYITTKKAIMQADMVRGQPTSDITKKFINQKKVLSKNLFESFPSQDIAITHLKDDIDKSILMEFPKSPFSSHNINSFAKEANNPLNTKSFVNKNLLISLNSKSSQNNQNNGYSNRDKIPNFNRDNIQNNIPYLWRQYSNNIVPSISVASESPDFQMPVQVSFSKQESSLLSAKVGSAKYEQNPVAQIVANKQLDAGSGQNYLNQAGVSVQPLLHNTMESKKQTISQGVRKNLIKQQPDLDCGDDWEGARGDFGTFCYKEIKVKATFDDALAECRRLKGDLFSILNAYENRYLQDNIHERFWIGYRDKGMDGNWNWTDGSKSIYTNWANNADGDDSKRFDCVYVEADQGLWKDAPCNKKQPFLCKKKKEVCPKDWKNLKLNSANGCYKLFETSLGWEDAEHECEKNHSHLASLTSEDEQTMVYQVHSSKSFWIGFNDRENEGDWMWSDRTTSSYTNWAERAPTNGGLSCTSMIDGGKWHDEPCGEKYKFVCKRKGPQPEKTEGMDSDGVLLPVARLMMRPETSPSHIYDDIAKGGLHPVTPKFFWPLLKISKSGLAGNRPMAAHGGVRVVPGGVALDGIHGFLDGGDFHGKCLADPKKCIKGFTIAIHIYFDKIVRQYKKEHCVIDTSGGGKGFTIFIANNKLNYKVVTDEQTWHLQTDLTVEIWEQIVMTWHKDKGLSVFVNGAFKDSETTSKKSVIVSNGPTRLIVGREDKDKGPYSCTKMVVASVAIFTKMLSIEDVPYAFTYGDTVVASYRWLMSGVQESVVPGAPEIEVKNTPTDIDGGIFIDGTKNWLEIDELDPMISDVYSKAKHGFAISFKIKFDQRVREYREPRYVIDSGGHVGGIRGVSVFVVNDNLYFQVIDSPDEDVLIWKVRVPVYTVRWQRVMMSWRLDKGLWVYLDGAFRGFTKTPITLPEEIKEIPKKLVVGRKIIGPDYAGAQFAFGCLAVYGRYLSHKESNLVFGGADNPFPGIIREVWKNLPGENITVLEKNPDYPNNPTTIEIIENFDAPFNVDNDYGSKVKGYFIAPETGNTTFYLSCSKSCKLFFSADEESKNKTVIISLNKPTWHNQWNKYANQSSKEIYLVAGKFYFLEAIQKGVDASDSLSVGVRMPTGRYQRPISIENLQWRLPGNQHAGLIREVWYNIPGYSISDLTSNINFPSKPSSTEVLDKFDAPFNVDDNYGSRISGYFRAPDTGDYRFYLATDSSGELWLSSDDSESNLVKLITLNGWTDHNQWLKYPEQRSEKIFLVSGQYYFIRVYMKADKLGDCASVAVELPSGHFEGPIKKKHLSWKLTNSKEGPGPKEIIEPLPKPVGLFALNDASVKDILLPGENKIILGDVDLTSGPTGLKDDAFLFKGNRSSYIEIPNDGKLDVKHSLTILANIYPMGEDGPIINFKRDGWGVHLWQFSKTQLFVRFVTREGKMSMQPLGTRVLQLNKWNQVGATYDKSSGVAQLWHDGKMVKSRNIGQVDLLTNAPIRLGAREGDDRFFKGKIACIQIYDRALSADQIGEVKHCPKQSKGSPIDIDDLTVFAQGSGIGPRLEESESVENRIGEDTEEELIVQGERSKVTRCDPSPCLNSGECIDDDKKIDGYKCICTSDFTGKHCQVSKPAAENPVMKRTVISYIKKDEEPIKQATSKADESLLLYQKIGCYKDDFLNSDLKIKISEISNLTQDHCVRACAREDNSSSYFGLQNGIFCFCGNKYGKYGKIADSFCNKMCPGNSEENCGGEFANNLFFFGRSKNYTIKTFTGKQQGAGTDAKIYVELLGDRGNSDFRQLDNAIDKYEPGSTDQQTFALPDLGNLKRVRILHDNSGSAPSWFLSKVEVTDELGHTEEFPCNDWLSETQSGGKLERDLFAKSIIFKPS